MLTLALQASLQAAGTRAAVVGSLRNDDGTPSRMLLSLAELFAQGLSFDWTTILPKGKRVPLPTYAFQRQRFWLEPPKARATDVGEAPFRRRGELLGGGGPGRCSSPGAALSVQDRDQQATSLAALLPALSTWRRLTEGTPHRGWLALPPRHLEAALPRLQGRCVARLAAARRVEYR